MTIKVLDIARVASRPDCYYVLARQVRSDGEFSEDFLIEVGGTFQRPVRDNQGRLKLKNGAGWVDLAAEDAVDPGLEGVETETVEVDVINHVKDRVLTRFERAAAAGETGNLSRVHSVSLDRTDQSGALAAMKSLIEGAVL